jgi:periplasmic divalent cation tolerance protein
MPEPGPSARSGIRALPCREYRPNIDKKGIGDSMTSEVLLVFCTCPDEETGARIAEALVAERLAACVTRMPALMSVYRWNDKVEQETETLLLIKTTNARFDALRARLCELHPYELPEIVAIPVIESLPEYLQWVSTCTSADA